uniref:TIR domain-containing protein n=1 Tax=Branchiostoma floridae TaxID=7739 RepID=C3YL25_BRAFL|eukprot:XP_002603004.1 hypothetical protein BRAFLDRAFT_84739 [Branchiostoma floridae]
MDRILLFWILLLSPSMVTSTSMTVCPEAFKTNPSVTIKAGRVLFSCQYAESLTNPVYPWEIVLEKDGKKIIDDDAHTSLKAQRFRKLNDWTSFLWCTVNLQHADAYGKYECRLDNDMKSNGSMTALQTFYVKPQSWPDQGSTEASYRFDVFISYSSADASWVREDLLRNLESNGYTVCLDTRDFIVGKPILTNIATGIYQSRKVIVVMSKNFIKSGWCWHELVLTYQRKLDQMENCVVVVKYDDCKIPMEIALRTYLDWTEPMARERFWANLHEWLGPPSPTGYLGEGEDKEEEDEMLLAIKDSGGGDPNGSQERDDVLLRQRQNIPSNGTD